MSGGGPARIADEYAKSLTTQEYGAGTRIDGVQVVELKRFVDDGGDFQEIVRMRPDGRLEAFPTFEPRQVNFSVMEPGAIKAWHLHLTQEDIWFVPPADRLLVGLLDCREGSPTSGKTMRIAMGAGKSRLLYIPRGVAHGAANTSTRPATILYLVNQLFSNDSPDERRLPWDHLGAEFWRSTPG